MIDSNMLDPERLKSGSQFLTSVIGLIINFQKERKSKKESAHKDFMEWLEYHRHDDVKAAIAGTQAVQDEVNKLLRDDHAQILVKLDSIDGVVTQILYKITGFEELGNDSERDMKLSDQALSVLYMLKCTAATQFAYLESHSAIVLHPNSGSIHVQEPKFIRDDIAILRRYGFIHPVDSSGELIFYSLTREGARFASVMNFNPPIENVVPH